MNQKWNHKIDKQYEKQRNIDKIHKNIGKKNKIKLKIPVWQVMTNIKLIKLKMI